MKKTLLLAFVLAVLAPWAVNAQVRTVSVGNWNATTSSALGGFHCTSKYSWTQTLYPQTDMGAAGWIQAIILDNRSTAAQLLDSAKIYLGHTTMTTHGTATVSTWVPQSDLTLVWSRTNYTIPGEVGQLIIELDQPFYYNGTGTLALVVSKAAQATNSNTKFAYTSTTASAKYTSGTSESYCRFPTVAGSNGAYKENIMFVMTTNQNDDYCLPLQGLHFVSATPNSVTVAWNGETGVTYELGYKAVGTNSDISPVSVSDTFYTVNSLEVNSLYWVYVRRLCSSGAYSGWDSVKVRTLLNPVYPPLSFDFDDEDDDDIWAIANATNGWYIDSVAGRRAMFISNDSGAHNAYSHTQGYSWAWVDVNLTESGAYGVSFDWRATGEGNFDYLRVALAPTSEMFSPVYADNLIANTFRTTIPAGWINISNTPDGQYKLNLSDTNWQHFTREVNIPDSMLGNYHLAIIWVNDNSSGTQPPAAIDNFVFQATSCFAADSFAIDSSALTSISADLEIIHSNASNFVAYWRKYGTSTYNMMEVDGTTASFTDLAPGTTYEGLIYTVCGDDTSFGYLPFQFTTLCGTLELPVTLDAEHYWQGSTTAPEVDCWNFVNEGNTTYKWAYNSTVSNVHSGTYTYSYTGTTTTNPTGGWNDWMITPVINFTAGGEITLWAKTSSSTVTNTYHGRVAFYATNEGMADSVSPASFSRLIVNGGDIVNNRLDFAGNTWQQFTVQLPDTLIGEHRLAFVVDQQSYTFYMDDINIHEINSCLSAYDVAVPDSSILSDEVVVVWRDSMEVGSYRVNYWAEGAGPDDTISLTIGDTVTSLENLTPNTVYYVTVTTLCSGGEAYSTYPVSFRTACLPVATASLPYVEDFESYASGAANPISPCWYKATSSTTAFPYPYSTAISGTRSLYFNGTTANIYSYAVLPRFESNLSDLMLEFDLKRYSTTTSAYHAVMMVGVMTDPSDITTFDTLRVIDMTSLPASSIRHYRVSLAGYNGTGRLAFCAPAFGASQYNPLYLDSVVVKPLPTCVWPENVAIDSVEAHSIYLSWQGTATQYELQADTLANFSTAVNATVSNATHGTITGLDAYKPYYVRVRRVCGSEYSEWSEVANTFTLMDCGENGINIFDTIGQGTSSTTSAAFYAGTTYRLGYSEHIYTAQEMNNMGLISNNLIHSIKLHVGSTGGTIRKAKVYMKEVSLNEFGSTAANDTVDRATMTLVYSGDLVTTANSWHEITLNTPFAYSGGSNLLIMFAHDTNTTSGTTFYYTTSGYTSAYGYKTNTGTSLSATRSTSRPNIVFNICTELAPCVRPSDVVADASDTELTLTWAGEASSYQVVIDTVPVNPDTVTAVTTNATTYSFSNLAPSTTYYYYVRGICDAQHVSEWSIEGNVTTACAAKALPYTENFESYNSGAANPIDPCWTKGTNNTTAYPYPYGTNAVTGYRSLYFYAYNSSSTKYYSYAALPLMQDSVKNLSLSFKVRRYSSVGNTYTSRLVIGVMTNPGDITTFEPMDTIDLKDEIALSIHDYEYLFSNYTGNGKYIAIYDEVPPFYGTATTCYSYAYVDDIVVDRIPSCLRPNNMSVSAVGETTATVHWNSMASNFDIEYGPQGFTRGTGTATTSTVDSVTLTGLTQGATYDVYVRAHCSATDSSAWSFAYTFLTACGHNPLPYTEDFESYGNGAAYPIGPCWTKGTDGTTAYPYPNGAASNVINGERCLYFGAYNSTSPYYSYAALPLMQDSVKNLLLSFNVRRYSTVSDSYTTRLVIGVMTNPADITTFTPMDTLDLRDEVASSVHSYEYYFSNYAGNGEYIAIYDEVPPTYGTATTCYSYAYVDDIVVDHIPSCYRPHDVTVDNIGQNIATVHWTGNAPSYEIEYGLKGFSHGNGITVTSTTDSIDLVGLMSGSEYDVYVRGLCSSTAMGNWSFAKTFVTVCGLTALPIVNDFEGVPTGSSAPMPNCWVKWNDNMTATYGYYPYVYNSSSSAHSGNNLAYFYLGSGTTYPGDAMLISPEIDTNDYPMNTVEVVFWAKRSSSYANKLIVGVVSDVNNPVTSFNVVDTIDLTATYNEYIVPLTNYTGYGNRLAFRCVRSTTAAYLYLDDISIEQISACERAYGLTAYDATNTSVTLEWEDTIGSTQWMVSYAIDSVNTWTEVTANSNPFTLTGLNANTLYRYRVAPVCFDGQVADWSREVARFTTSQVPATVPYSYDFESPAEWGNWQTSSNREINWYRGNVAQGNNTNAMYISVDNGATHSWNMSAITNAVAYRDIDFGPDVHGYQLEFDAYIGGTTDANYDGIAVVVADPAIPVASVSTAITSPWGHVNNVSYGTVRHDTLWGHHTVYLDGMSGVKRVAFYHFNQAQASSHPFENNPSAIDNVSITMQPCERPTELTSTPLTPYRTLVEWEGDTAATYQVSYRKRNGNIFTDRMVTGTSVTLTSLTPSAEYYWWVRKVCTLTETDTLVSSWVGPYAFTAPCVAISVGDTLHEGFENVTTSRTQYNATNGRLPSCWESWSSDDATVYPHVSDTGSYSYWVEGNAGLTMTSSSTSTNYGTNSYVVMPEIAEPTNTLTLAFWYCYENVSYGELSVGYITGSDYENDFVVVKTISSPVASAAHDGNGLQLSRGVRDTVSFAGVPDGNFRLAFRWFKESTFYSVSLDDIAVWTSAPTCLSPVIDTIDATDTTIAIGWSGSYAQDYEVAIVEGEWDDPDMVAIVSGNTYTFSGLTAETHYTIGVRAVCSETSHSGWTFFGVTTPEHPCAVPTGLTASGMTYTSAVIGWTEGEEGQGNWQIHLTGEGYDQYHSTATNPYQVNGLDHGVTYTFTVRAICGEGDTSDWSASATFTTLSCEAPTAVTVGSITSNSAVVNWTAPAGATRFVVNYGDRGFNQGTGSFDTVENATSCTLTGLLANMPYDVYVRTLCGDGIASSWSTVAQFTTERNGIDDVANAAISLYPNPASSTVTLKGIEGKATVTVVDMNGRKAGEWTVSDGQLTIDVTEMAQGAYFVRIVGEQVNAIRKLIVR